jgi:tetratricopeptide (TPR) repeat protein
LPATAAALVDEATRFTNGLVQGFAGKPDGWEVKALFMDWLGRSEEAAACWEKCIALDPRYGYAYLGLGNAAAAKGDYAKAVKLLRKAAQLTPGSFQAQSALAEALVNSGQPKEAIAALEGYVAKDPRSYGLFLLGQAYSQMQQYGQAREKFEAAVRKYPEFAEAYYRLSIVCARLGQSEQAKRYLEKSQALKAGEREDSRVQKKRYDDLRAMRNRVAETYITGARLCYVEHRAREAERLWRRAADLDGANVECRQGLAWMCRTQGRLQEAIGYLEQLAKLQPNQPSYWMEIGNLHVELSQFKAAQDAFRRFNAAKGKR